jgi:hypothetical protein
LRVSISSLALIGTSRRLDFLPGLNVVTGPITTGKTTVLRLCRVLLGNAPEPARFPREVRDQVHALGGDVLLADQRYAIVRPFVSTPTAKVDIAGPEHAWRLPAVQADETASTTYIRWLLKILGLPELRVRTAPTQPESETSPVTVNDYMMYCYLSQADIDSSVFGATDHFRDVKRRYVFQILYGLFNAEAADLEEQLRQVLSDLRQLQSQTRAFERFLQGTALENRAAVANELHRARTSLVAVEADATREAETARAVTSEPGTGLLHARIQELDRQRNALVDQITREQGSAEQLGRLANQLEAQSVRLTRSIVAGDTMLDFEFVVCPRCGTPVDAQRGIEDRCMLCLQIPQRSPADRDALIGEQDRIGAQVLETRQLIATHHETVGNIESELAALERERASVAASLDFSLRTYISDEASGIAERAAERARLESDVRRLEDYMNLYVKLDQALGDTARLTQRREELEAALEVARSRQEDAETRIQYLERELLTILERFDIPRFGEPLSATIDRQTYMPIVNGRRWAELSSAGLQVLVNVAHALAHHRTALAFNMPLPQILLIDGLTSNVGHEGLDAERVQNVYDYLIEQSQEKGDELQVIVADNDVPAQAADFVRLRLTEEDRLIPQEGGSPASSNGSHST